MPTAPKAMSFTSLSELGSAQGLASIKWMSFCFYGPVLTLLCRIVIYFPLISNVKTFNSIRYYLCTQIVQLHSFCWYTKVFNIEEISFVHCLFHYFCFDVRLKKPWSSPGSDSTRCFPFDF